MADDTEDAAPPAATPAPPLQDFQAAFTHPAAQEWAGEVTTRLNDYFQRRDLADASAQAGHEFVANVDQFKSGLVSMVQSDPHAVHTALDIVPPTVAALVSTMPGGMENPEDHHTALTGHMQREVAVAAVTSAADQHEGLARGMLEDERINGILGESVKPLTAYIMMQADARERDMAAQRGQQAAAAVRTENVAARNYLGDLVGPDNTPRSPDGWNQSIIADPRLPPQTKLDLMGVHDRLGTGGDQPTDPMAVADLIHRAATGQAKQNDLYPMIGANLSMADAGVVAAAMHNPKYLKQLDDTIQQAHQRLAPNGDIAETRALGRFVSWLMPQVHAGAVLDPRSKDYVLGGENLPDFRVQGDDLPKPAPAERPSLSSIFGGAEKAIAGFVTRNITDPIVGPVPVKVEATNFSGRDRIPDKGAPLPVKTTTPTATTSVRG